MRIIVGLFYCLLSSILVLGTLGSLLDSVIKCLLSSTSHKIGEKAAEIEHSWGQFKSTHGKSYHSTSEEFRRKQVFAGNFDNIRKHNEKYNKGEVSYDIELNQHGDLTDQEIIKQYYGISLPLEELEALKSNTTEIYSTQLRAKMFKSLETFDWRNEGIMPPIKNQAGCGACWAFSTVGALEAQIKIRTGVTVSLSEQHLIDCVYDHSGCDGGYMTAAYHYIIRNEGIASAAQYNYEGQYGACRYSASMKNATMSSYGTVPRGREDLMLDALLEKGPLAVALEASGDFARYSKGVYHNPECQIDYLSNINHAMVIVGYGTENEKDYWLVRNSWGNWGDGGYGKLARNRDNNCNIASWVSYPIL